MTAPAARLKIDGQQKVDVVIKELTGGLDTIRHDAFSSLATCAPTTRNSPPAIRLKPKACDTESILKGAKTPAHSDRGVAAVGEEMIARLRQDLRLDMQALFDQRLSHFEDYVQELLAQQTAKLIKSREHYVAVSKGSEASEAEMLVDTKAEMLVDTNDSEATPSGQASGPRPAASLPVPKASAVDGFTSVQAPPAAVTLEEPSQDEIQTRPQEDCIKPRPQLERGGTAAVLSKVEGMTEQLVDHDREKAAAEAEEALHVQTRNKLIRMVPCQSLREFILRFDKKWHSLKEPERHGFLENIERSGAFFAFSIAVVLADQVLSVFVTNYSAENAPHGGPSTRQDYAIAEQVFLTWFAVEILLKMFVHRLFFFIGEHWKMNYLDSFLVLYSLFEHLGIDLSFLRALRVFKMCKVVRMLKFVTVFHELRLMLDSIMGSFFTLVWAIALVLVLCYMFALMMVQCMTDYIREDLSLHDENALAKIERHFGTVQDAIVSLIMALTGGFDWGELYYLLKASGEVGQFATFFVVLFFHISVWNIIGSVYVDKVIALANPTPHERAEQYRCHSRADLYEIGNFFEGLDESGNGALNEVEFMRVCLRGGLLDFLSDRGVDLKENARTFFEMAASRSGQKGEDADVPIKEITKLCRAVKGKASLLDVAILGHEMRAQFQQSQAMILNIQSHVGALARGTATPEWKA